MGRTDPMANSPDACPNCKRNRFQPTWRLLPSEPTPHVKGRASNTLEHNHPEPRATRTRRPEPREPGAPSHENPAPRATRTRRPEPREPGAPSHENPAPRATRTRRPEPREPGAPSHECTSTTHPAKLRPPSSGAESSPLAFLRATPPVGVARGSGPRCLASPHGITAGRSRERYRWLESSRYTTARRRTRNVSATTVFQRTTQIRPTRYLEPRPCTWCSGMHARPARP
jgi:hypothetical protein